MIALVVTAAVAFVAGFYSGALLIDRRIARALRSLPRVP